MKSPLAALLCMLGLAAVLLGCGDGGDRSSTIPPPTVAPRYAASAQANSYDTVLQALYLAFFGRPADPAGLRYYSSALTTLGAPTDLQAFAAAYQSNLAIRNIVDGLGESPEAAALYGDDANFLIAAIYKQSFNRDAEAAGIGYWANAITRAGLNRAAAALSIVAGARNEDLVTFERKVQAARTFTNSVDTAAGRAFYDGLGANALVRDMLAKVRGSSTDAELDALVAQASGTLAAKRAYVIKDGYAEVPAADRVIVLLVAPDQLGALRSRLDTLAPLLAADMNGHASPYGARWSVLVRQAEATASAVREQLKGSDGAILIGDVAVPTRIDLGDGSLAPFLDPYRLPLCARYRFTRESSFDTPALASDNIWINTQDPLCRNGAVVSLLRGTSAARQQTEIAAKLDQMIAYHRDRGVQDATWTRRYERINALWLGNIPGLVPDNPGYWDNVPLYTPDQLAYQATGTGAQRLAAFLSCLASKVEVCSFNGHGSSDAIIAEGPDATRDFYSSDSVYFPAGDLRGKPMLAKFVNLSSCSTHNFLSADSFASTLLMTGQTMLTLGSTMVMTESADAEKEDIAAKYQSLSYGATFAEAYIGKIDNTPLNFQGDPFIALRARPGGAQPKLIVDGKHYNTHPAIVETAFGDIGSTGTAYKSVRLSNAGSADLRLRFSISVTNVTATELVYDINGTSLGGHGFSLLSPQVWNVSGDGNTGNIVFVVKPGATLDLRFGLAAFVPSTTGKPVMGVYTGNYEFYSNDPDSPRVMLEMKGSVHQ